ncbi:MAG: hypothetical protein Q4F65_07440 [Propionibacteriaceae bacterium]|nr:hypothetical protein [Propionibacteriaceae bacterium]
MSKKIPAIAIGLVLLAGVPAAAAAPTAPAPASGPTHAAPTPSSAVALADATPVKEEVVYAHLAADGTVERILVVNAFPDAPSSFVDHGRYREVSNLSTTDELERAEDRVTIATPGGEFYYQGELASTDAPWLLSLEYWLDGSQVSAADLRGRSGNLEIRGQVRQNPAVDPVYYDNYMLQISITLDTAHFSRVASEGATIASQGSAKVVNLTSMPGEDTDFTVTAEASNAHLGTIQAAGLPFSMAVDLPDAAAYTGDLVELSDAIATLAAGVRDYTNGVGEVADASGGLDRGAAELAAGARQVSDGFEQLAAGRGEFDAGLRDYNAGVGQFADGIGQLDDGLGSFADGLARLAEGSGALSSGLEEYAGGVAAFSAGLDQTAEGSAALTDGLTELAAGLAELAVQGKYADQNLVGGSAQILAALQALEAGVAGPVSDADLQALRGLLGELTTSLDALEATLAQADVTELRETTESATSRLSATSERIAAIAAEMQDTDAIVADLGLTVTDNPEAQALLDHLDAQGQRLSTETAELDAIASALAGLDVDGLAAALEAVSSDVTAVRADVEAMDAALAAVPPRDADELARTVAALSAQYQAFHGGLVGYVDGVEDASVGLAGEPGCQVPDPEDPDGAPIPAPCFPELAQRYPHLVTGTPGALSGAYHLRNGLQGLSSAGGELSTGAQELAEGGSALHEGVLELQGGADQFASEADRIVDGANALADGGDALVAGHRELVGADRPFAAGLRDLSAGLSSYHDGTGQLVDGLGQLDSAGQQLSDGAATLRDETRDMDQQMETQMDEALADFLPKDFTLTSFTSPENTGIKQVQFVYLTDAQTEPEETAPVEEEPVQKTWWDRILDIFR